MTSFTPGPTPSKDIPLRNVLPLRPLPGIPSLPASEQHSYLLCASVSPSVREAGEVPKGSLRGWREGTGPGAQPASTEAKGDPCLLSASCTQYPPILSRFGPLRT